MLQLDLYFRGYSYGVKCSTQLGYTLNKTYLIGQQVNRVGVVKFGAGPFLLYTGFPFSSNYSALSSFGGELLFCLSFVIPECSSLCPIESQSCILDDGLTCWSLVFIADGDRRRSSVNDGDE